MKKATYALAQRSTFLRIFMRNTRNFIHKILYRLNGISVKVDDKLIIFSAYNGKGYSCSPKAVYEYLIASDKYSDYKFVWLFDKPEEYAFLTQNKNTIVIKNKSKECEKYLHLAKYWIFNFRALDYWSPTKEQTYVQCWHGTPLKKLGYDITKSDNAMNSLKEIRSKYKIDTKRFDYIISPCKFVTEKFSSAWNLSKFGKSDAVLEVGYPRNDYLTNYDENDIEMIKKKLGIENDERKIILYAPTWRDNQHGANGYTYDNPVDFDYLQNELGDEYIILFRAHYLVASEFNFDEYKGFVYDASKHDDINELYVIADMLITDYSSVFFDYAILNRPMLFYMYDMEQYRDELRGFYIDVNTLPGEIIKTKEKLVSAINSTNYNNDYNKDKLAEFNIEYNLLNDGKASARLIKTIIK